MMCGFAGAVRPGTTAEDWTAGLSAMAASLRHRGPDDEGLWFDAAAGVGLAHRRLSILDLSPAGHQPMLSASGRWVIAYNGEVYNFEALREELGGSDVAWRGHSDTEVILAAVERWGVEAALERCCGMFAFALWDRQARELVLVRDRVGIKPLYYGRAGDTFLFGSELKALRAHPAGRQLTVDPDVLALQLRFNFIPAPYSIYRGVHKLEPGHVLRLKLDAATHAEPPESRAYWDWAEVAERGSREPFAGSEQEALDRLDALLRDAVKTRMVADVPLGAFLSGGIDSSTVVALMQAQSDRPVKTFSIGFGEQGYDEARYAKAVARHLGTEHTELYVAPQDALDVIPALPTMFDEPFSDSSQVPTYLVSELARRHVTVSLSGDGGDELFAGYPRYALGRDLWRRLGWMPTSLRRGIGAMLLALPKGLLDATLFWMAPMFNRYGRMGSPGDKFKKLAEILAQPDAEALYHEIVSHWKRPAEVVRGAAEPRTRLTSREGWPILPDLTQRMMYLDSVTYLPDDILVKVDRASMAVSLEARVPILDHRVVEFAWRLPMELKVRDGGVKWALRQVLYRYVPRELIDRPKMGFGVPLDAWLRGPLREWGESLLAEKRLRAEGIFEPEPIRTKWREHQAGERNWHYYLWDVLMFQAWMEAQTPTGGAGGASSATDQLHLHDGLRTYVNPRTVGTSDD